MVSVKTGIVALLLALLTLNGCASSQPSSSAAWLTPEPLAVPYRTELAIARLTEILQRAELTEEQSARLYYDRGVMYDSAGLRSLARLDFMRALRLKPDMADAYNFVGIHYTLNGSFDQAYEAFDSALELAPDYEYAYLNRGIALYYAGRADLAVPDFVRFLELRPADPYRVVWLYLAESDISEADANSRLSANLATLDADDWATNIPRFYHGDISEQQLLNSVLDGLSSQRLLAERLCEVYFYLAKWHEAKQRPEKAINYYKKVLATNVYEFVEHRYARLEIARLRGETLAGETDEFH
ncbi:lipoprotein NlpI [Arsukibacterium indicum]|uniref:Lipoprotein NlpI n=1 Tax=Arsukibacterium indicum TaxID=2848612 RepID=A0ABS6MLB3_9GAMM|nr:lipoprotein NlpI [Arsukibacterium indicum]MBV2129535.1 lipoprotein NlpI [Arsukibacterium indicum]